MFEGHTSIPSEVTAHFLSVHCVSVTVIVDHLTSKQIHMLHTWYT